MLDIDALTHWRDRLGRVGIWTGGLDGIPAVDVGAAAARVEAAGAGSLFFAEAYGREAFTQASLALAGTTSLVVGTGIANIHARDAVASRAAQATLAASSGDRFVLGLGVSHRPIVEGMRRHDYGSPLGTMRAYLEGLGSTQPFVPDPVSGPVLVAALGPRMLELSAELADGVHPYLTTPEHTVTAREAIGPDKLLVVEQAATLVDDADEHQRRAHTHLEIYTGLPNYRNSWFRLGFTEEDAVRGGSQRLKDALVPHGVDAAVSAIEAHLDAGADHVVVQVLGEHPLHLDLDAVDALLAATALGVAGDRART